MAKYPVKSTSQSNGTHLRTGRSPYTFAGVFLLAMGWLYRLLFAPLELLRGVDEVGYIAEDGRSRAQAANELFKKRPMWSRSAVKANINVHPEKMKHLLPYLAYYMLTGPWRSLWVRFGYDPRKTPEAKIYQVLDFRIRYRMKHGFSVNDMPVKSKRSAYHYSRPTTINRAVPQPASVTDITQESSSSSGPKPATAKYILKDSVYIFRDGMLPPYRQMFYQLCDLDVEKIKNIIHKNDGKEEVCDERDGWCVPHTADELRNIISGMIQQYVRASRPASSTQKPVRTRPKTVDSGEEEDEDDDDDEDYKPSDGSENEMETEIADYM